MVKSSRKIWQIHINGVVQSVGFRPFIKNLGDNRLLRGYVRNLGGAGVEVVIETNESKKDEFISSIQNQLPELAIITNIDVKSIETDIEFLDKFEIKKSDVKNVNGSSFSAIPPDISICSNCTNDIFHQDRRIDYSFTSCTDCGPRYATIFGLPYDRPVTSFNDFPLCKDCINEYTEPSNRRFHAQTTCCVNCGPKYAMYRWTESWNEEEFNWNSIISGLKGGKIISIMGLSGTHFALDALNSLKVKEFRKLRRKHSDKPFAVMMKDLSEIEKYCFVSEIDVQILTSARKPIVILPVKDLNKWDDISPGLSSIGVMLPYSGFHHILFKKGAPSVLIMTSANRPGVPMPITPEKVMESSVSISDLVIVHNRKIIQRTDDSVIRSHGNNLLLIRRARGYTPQPFFVEQLMNTNEMIAFGSEENNTISFSKSGWVLPSQHLGHIANLESQEFQNSTVEHLSNLFYFNPKTIITDLHPDFTSTKSAHDYAIKKDIPFYSVQHHVAHASSLALDNNLGYEDSILAWVCDGFGYGSDGQAWGGELIEIDNGSWKRAASLIPIDYDGADQNAKFPARMLINYLKKIGLPLEFFNDNLNLYFPQGKREFEYLVNKKEDSKLTTTSLGRLLDSFSVLLESANQRSYDGEPAIKFEGLATIGKPIIDYKPAISRHGNMEVIDNLEIMRQGIEMMKSYKRQDIALWVHNTIGVTLGEIATNVSNETGIRNIGFSGGIAYNKLITQKFRAELQINNLNLLTHINLPPGDGGISTGQIYYHGVLKNE
ncbi:MAG: Carbamoyltransferase HypF [Candidatus Heimdallarchaeota archaeon LC_2]|nr:MAG: Carbamoyltransferase HypF [Candidatus Heimdallarchaeota archaeon LC_2]